MGSINISLITVTFNAADTLERCIKSVIEQGYSNLEYIIIDALSNDNTAAIIDKYRQYITHVVTEPDQGLFDAMNKGIALATGDIIGTLNADDYFADNSVLIKIAEAFTLSGAVIIYGDIDYVNHKDNIIRKWRSGVFKEGYFNWGWMPPHPSFYAKRELFSKLGKYHLQYGSATDYELMLRFMHKTTHKVYYLNKVLVKMQIGGVSNKSISNRVKAWRNDYKAMQANRIKFPFLTIVLKPLRKIIQFIT